MLDINLIINDTESIVQKLKSRGYILDVKPILELYHQRKKTIKLKEDIAAEKNKVTDEFKTLKTDSEREKITKKSQGLEKKINNNKLLLERIEIDLNNILLQIPNLPSDSVPCGADESANVITKTWGNAIESSIEHSEIFIKNKLLDFESAVTISKSRFIVMKNQIAKLHRSLITYMMNMHTEKYDYTEYYVPYIVNNESMIGTGQLPKFKEDLFKIHDSDLYLIPTAEVPLTNLYRNKILNENDLPQKLVAHTPCFRSEAGSYGKDTKGIIRQHQFEKVELVHIIHPKNAETALEEITLQAESILEGLDIPYQRVSLSTGDLGFAASITNDLEAWFPSQNKYREVSSCSCFTDFQSRRLNIKYKDETKKKNYVFTLNGSGLAAGRTMAALIENHTKDKVIHIPEALHNFTGFKTIKL
jgi:seryl-tRNA synthetase|tara:strand:+ start:3639 stop:4892 length:1254 start_codon:yes stop_codon:yes gene_type:complete